MSKSISVRNRQRHIFVEARVDTDVQIVQLVFLGIAEDEQLCQVRRLALKLQLGKIQWLLWRTFGTDDNSTCGAELSY